MEDTAATSHVTPRCPVPGSPATTSPNRSRSRSSAATRAPSTANARAVARPIPDAAPVTTTNRSAAPAAAAGSSTFPTPSARLLDALPLIVASPTSPRMTRFVVGHAVSLLTDAYEFRYRSPVDCLAERRPRSFESRSPASGCCPRLNRHPQADNRPRRPMSGLRTTQLQS